MKYAADFRATAREALRGRWVIAVFAGLIASLLGGIGNNGPEFKLNIDASGVQANFEIAGQTIYSIGGSPDSDVALFLLGSAVYVALTAIAMAIVFLILGSIVEIGYARFNLDLVDSHEPAFGTLFAYFSYWKTAVVARLLQILYVLLWSLLLIIPGIIASYSYAMTGYILAENPNLTASEAIARSKELMSGNRWRLFCLHFSFIGWSILCFFTMGIGNLFLRPYEQAATAAFYREISDPAVSDTYYQAY